MAVYGYARCSTKEQSLDIQINALKQAGCTNIRSEKKSGTSLNGRTELETLMSFLQAGDTLMITRTDRLARSVRDLANLVARLEEMGVSLKATEQPVDTSSASGKCFLGMLSVFAEFETNIRKERQLEGIEAAKSAGKYKGRPVEIDAVAVKAKRVAGMSAIAIAKEMNICRASVYAVLKVAA
jgi:DNA invertase Pin-like site-specific DNA recombinase